MTLLSRRGSRWMSEARWSKAYCQSQSTTWMTPESLASSCLELLPSSTSCSKLASAEVSPILVALRTEREGA